MNLLMLIQPGPCSLPPAAQPPCCATNTCGGGPPPPPGLDIDGYIYFFFLLALAYGIYALRRKITEV